MALYFFNLHECGTITLADEGVERTDLESLRQEALIAARDVMAAQIKEGNLCLGCHIEVVTAAGETVLTQRFKDSVTLSGL